ncbi:unnamed protein product [Toxocara canis]|uniref:Fringe-like glycosyltransferase domain-containing protein n=1 Tax=Toxocara canis TaxID=6265 RepID=A0A3P7FIV5_TOXCA|nr:unnamed protein product [Toxocara canis]
MRAVRKGRHRDCRGTVGGTIRCGGEGVRCDTRAPYAATRHTSAAAHSDAPRSAPPLNLSGQIASSQQLRQLIDLDDVIIAIKTTEKYHESRTNDIIETWFQLAPHNVRTMRIFLFVSFLSLIFKVNPLVIVLLRFQTSDHFKEKKIDNRTIS